MCVTFYNILLKKIESIADWDDKRKFYDLW